MKTVTTAETGSRQKSGPVETLEEVSELVDAAQVKVDAAGLRFVGYMLRMARTAIREELERRKQ